MSLILLKAGHPLYRGYVLSHLENKNVLLRGAITGETVLASIVKDKKDYFIADTIKVIDASDRRITPECVVYGLCGGCHYQHISYDKQIQIKESILTDCLKRIGKLEIRLATPLVSQPFRYRHKAVFKKDDELIGFYKMGSQEIVEVSDCPIVKEEIIKAKDLSRRLLNKVLKAELEIVSGLNTQVSIKSNHHGIKSYSLKDDTLIDLKNRDTFVELNLGKIRYRVLPFSFFQTNWVLNNKVVEFVLQAIDFRDKDVIDIYSGAGNFALPISLVANTVTAYESDHRAVQSANLNKKLNKIDNCRFFQSPVEEINIDNKPDVLITNPPRSGITNRAMERIINLGANEMVYMSCDPSTMARDLGKLKNFYDIETLLLIDFFPQTFHIETLAVMRRR